MTQVGTKKSRNGCTHCKRRRVKCDERVPCANCVRRNQDCSLLQGPSQGGSPSSNHSGLQDLAGWAQDLELMHHYSVRAAYALGFLHKDSLDSTWRDEVPKLAIDHSFLMHGLLAWAALHLIHCRPEHAARYQRLCDRHQTVAISQFRDQLVDINADNVHAMFALAAVFSASTVGRITLYCEPDTNSPQPLTVDQLVEQMVLTRGVRDIVASGYHWLVVGPMASQLTKYSMPDTAQIPRAVAERFAELEKSMYTAACEDPTDLETMMAATTTVREIWAHVATEGPERCEPGYLMRWHTMLPAHYITLLRDHHPAAIILAVHFNILWDCLRDFWFVQDWPVRSIAGFQPSLDEKWHHWLDWPKQQVQNGLPVFRTTLQDYTDPIMRWPYPGVHQAAPPLDLTGPT